MQVWKVWGSPKNLALQVGLGKPEDLQMMRLYGDIIVTALLVLSGGKSISASPSKPGSWRARPAELG